jgi:hypothetical protein
MAEFGVLFSHACETTIPGLVIGGYTAHSTATDAAIYGARAAGVKATTVRRDADGEWRTTKGLSPVEAIRKGEVDGWKGWLS